MGTYDNQPGGGYQPVKGYNPPAGSQAEKIDLANQASRARANDSFSTPSPSYSDPFPGASSRSSGSRSQPKRSPAPSRAKASQGPSLLTRLLGGATPKSAPRPAAPTRPWHPFFGVVGFLAVTLVVGSYLSGENKWILAAAIGIAGGAIIGRLWKPILALALVGGGLWIFSKSSRNDAGGGGSAGYAPTYSSAPPTVSTPGYDSLVMPAPVLQTAPPAPVPTPAPAPPPTPRMVRKLPPPADQFPGGAANAFLNDTEAVYNVDHIVDTTQITIRHVREIPSGEVLNVLYSPRDGHAWVTLSDNLPFPLGLTIDPADADAWRGSKLVWFLKVTPQDTREPSDPGFAVLLKQSDP